LIICNILYLTLLLIVTGTVRRSDQLEKLLEVVALSIKMWKTRWTEHMDIASWIVEWCRRTKLSQKTFVLLGNLRLKVSVYPCIVGIAIRP